MSGLTPDQEFRSGELVPASGIYQMRDSEDVDIREVTCVKGEPFPPTDEPGGYFVLVRATNAEPITPATAKDSAE